MSIHFYSIRNCEYEMYNNKPAIFAPEGADIDSLIFRYYFFQTEDGRWCHYLTKEENDYITSLPQAKDVTFEYPDENKSDLIPKRDSFWKDRSNILCVISVLLLASALFVGIKFAGLSMIVSLVLMIFVRVEYPDNLFGKILMIVYIILGIILVIALIMLMSTCLDTINSCNTPYECIPG